MIPDRQGEETWSRILREKGGRAVEGFLRRIFSITIFFVEANRRFRRIQGLASGQLATKDKKKERLGGEARGREDVAAKGVSRDMGGGFHDYN